MKNTIRILSIDPGTAMFGWAIQDFDIKLNHTTVSRFGTIKGQNIYRRTLEIIPDMDRRFTIIEGLQVCVEDIINTYKPDIMASEDTFFNPKRPAAFQSLTLVIGMCERVAWYKLKQPLYKYPPQQVKKTVSNFGGASKTTVREALMDQDLTIKDTRQSPIERLDEHSSDAIAVGQTFILTDLPMLLASNPQMFEGSKKEKKSA